MEFGADILGSDSTLAAILPDFAPRPAQQLMAEAVADALRSTESLVIEAGTGTGKTFAYLAPALASGMRTIVSTGTRALQDQLYHRDIPLLVRALGSPAKLALLKGRSNYLCIARLATARQRTEATRFARELNEIEAWASATQVGDRREVTSVPEESGVWSWVTSTIENCIGQRCEFYERCHVVKARRRAQSANVIVVNHHLLLADLAMKEGGFDQFLPGADTFVLDEAHQLADIAGQFFGTSLGTRLLASLLDEIVVETLAVGDEAMRARVGDCQSALLKLRDAAPREQGRSEYLQLQSVLEAPLGILRERLADVYAQLQPLSEVSPALDSLTVRVFDRLNELAAFVDENRSEGLRWVDVRRNSMTLNLTPLDVSTTLGSMLTAHGAAWIFTSATLAIGEDFSHFTSRLGIGDVRTIKLDSPYDLGGRSRIYLPPGLPEPADKSYTLRVMEAVQPLLDMTRGGVFVLFTSHRALAKAAEWVRERPARIPRSLVLVQGEGPRDDLLRRFRAQGDAVLLATGTFWEGVDVRGAALTMVVIDKLPFASPGDPLVMARLEYLKRRGENGFMEHQLPQAVLSLKQGVGRLLRDDADYGVVVLCDPRITSKAYGQKFLDALRPMPNSSDSADIGQFFAAMEA